MEVSLLRPAAGAVWRGPALPVRARLQLLALTLNAGKHTANQPARLAQLDHGNDGAILVQGDEGPAQVIQLGHQGTPSVICQRRWCHLLAPAPYHLSVPPKRKAALTPRSMNSGGRSSSTFMAHFSAAGSASPSNDGGPYSSDRNGQFPAAVFTSSRLGAMGTRKLICGSMS